MFPFIQLVSGGAAISGGTPVYLVDADGNNVTTASGHLIVTAQKSFNLITANGDQLVDASGNYIEVVT